MAALGWNEIQKKAIKFVHEWYGVTNERAEAQSFLNEFLNVFGVSRKKVAFLKIRLKKQMVIKALLICFGRVKYWLK